MVMIDYILDALDTLFIRRYWGYKWLRLSGIIFVFSLFSLFFLSWKLALFMLIVAIFFRIEEAF